MSAITYSKSTGDIIAFTLHATTDELAIETDEYARMKADIPLGATNYYVKNGALVERPSRPSTEHVWDGFQWVVDTPYVAQRVRLQRSDLLINSDWTDTLSAKTRLGDAKYNEWQVYRQALRDITAQPGFPTNVVWPTPPA